MSDTKWREHTRWSVFGRQSADLFVLLALAVLLRTPKLFESLWLDEGYSLAAARHLQGGDAQRPFYFVFLSLWKQLGESEVWLRLPSVAFGLAAIAMTFATVKRVSTREAALLTALLMTLAAPNIYHAQEVRMYSLAPLLLVATAYFLIRWLEDGRAFHLALHTLLAVAALLTFPPVLAGIACLWLFAGWSSRSSRKRLPMLLASSALTLALWVPFASLVVAPRELVAWLPAPKPIQLITVHGWAFVGDALSPGDTPRPLLDAVGKGLPALLVIGLSLLGYRSLAARVVGVWYYGILSAIFLMSVFVASFWFSRYFIPFFPALYYLVAEGLLALRAARRWIFQGTAALLLTLEVAAGILTDASAPIEDWRATARIVTAEGKAGDLALVSALPLAADGSGVWQHYYRGAPQVVYWRSKNKSAVEWTSHAGELMAGLAPGSTLWIVLRTAVLGNQQLAALAQALGAKFAVTRSSLPGVELLAVRARAEAPPGEMNPDPASGCSVCVNSRWSSEQLTAGSGLTCSRCARRRESASR